MRGLGVSLMPLNDVVPLISVVGEPVSDILVPSTHLEDKLKTCLSQFVEAIV